MFSLAGSADVVGATLCQGSASPHPGSGVGQEHARERAVLLARGLTAGAHKAESAGRKGPGVGP